MFRLYRKWMHGWETRLNQRDSNRIVRPLDWGIEWTRNWPLVNGASTAEPSSYLRELNCRIIADSQTFFSYDRPKDFCLQDGMLHFTSPVATPYAQNNTVKARWFPASGKRAVVVLPQWNCDALSHNGLCRLFSLMGIAALRLSLPYHDLRMPLELGRADYAVSSNIGRTIDAARQAIVDVRSCLDWLAQRGFTELGIVGTSLGSCYAFIASAHDSRLKTNVFNHASTYFADVVWTGQTTQHIRRGIDSDIDLATLHDAWLAISPMSYFEKFASKAKKSLIVYASYDLTFPPQCSRDIIAEFQRRSLDLTVRVLPCGHYSSGETPFKYLDAWYMARFLAAAFS